MRAIPTDHAVRDCQGVRIGVARIFTKGALFQKVDDLFFVVVLDAQAKTAELTTPPSKPSEKFL